MMLLNENLFKQLAHALRMTYKEISSQSNIAMTTLYRIIEAPSKISVQQLLNLANGLQIPVSRFFSKDSTEPIGQREDYIKFDGYKDCYYDKTAMQEIIDSSFVSSYRDIAFVVGLHPNRVKESLLAEHRLPVTRLLKFCDTLKINYTYFLVDPNPISVNARKQKDVTATASEYDAILQDIATMLREQAVFRAEVRRDITRLEKKIDMIIDAYFEELTDPDEAEHTTELTKQIAKEVQTCGYKKLAKEEIVSRQAI